MEATPPPCRCGDARGPFLIRVFVFATVLGTFICQRVGQVVGSEDARGPSLVHGSCETLSLARTSVCRLAITVARPGTTSIGSRRPPTRTPSAAIWDPCPAAVNILTQNILFTQLAGERIRNRSAKSGQDVLGQ